MDKMRIRRLVLIAAATLISACKQLEPAESTGGNSHFNGPYGLANSLQPRNAPTTNRLYWRWVAI
jgi:hypothetical protein